VKATFVVAACSAAAVDPVADVGVEDGEVSTGDGEVGTETVGDGTDAETGVGVGTGDDVTTAEPALEDSDAEDVDVDEEFVPEPSELAAERVQVLTARTASFP
jgi:hypothetical protein